MHLKQVFVVLDGMKIRSEGGAKWRARSMNVHELGKFISRRVTIDMNGSSLPVKMKAAAVCCFWLLFRCMEIKTAVSHDTSLQRNRLVRCKRARQSQLGSAE